MTEDNAADIHCVKQTRNRLGLAMTRDARIQQGRRLRGLYRSLGLDRPGAAKLLHVSERTLRNWESGVHEVPFAVLKVLRMLNYHELPGKAWAGWCFSGGKLVSPEGHTFVGSDCSWWSLFVRRAQLFSVLHEENTRLRQALGAERQAGAVRVTSSAPGGCEAPRPPAVAGGRREAPALNLFHSHITTEHHLGRVRRGKKHA